MAPRLLLAALLAVGCTCQSDTDCPLDEQCSEGVCVARTADTASGTIAVACPDKPTFEAMAAIRPP